MESCKDNRIRELIVLELYGELDNARKQDLDRHLAECPVCRQYREGLGRIKGYLDAYQVPDRDMPVPSETPCRVRSFLPGYSLKGLIAGLAMFVVVAGVFFLNRPRSLTGPVPAVREEGSGLPAVRQELDSDMLKNLDFYRDNDLFNNIDLLDSMEEYNVNTNTEEYI